MQNLVRPKVLTSALAALLTFSGLVSAVAGPADADAQSWAMINQARTLRRQLKPEQALSVLNETIKRYPNFPTGYDSRSDLNRDLGNMTLALSDTEKTIALCPGNLGYIKKRAKLNDMTGHLKEAIADYDYVLTKEPKTFSVWRDRAIAYKRLKNYPQAAASFEKAVTLSEVDNSFNDLLYDRAQMFLLAGNPAKALEGADELIKRFPHMSKGYWIRAQVYDTLGKAGSAALDRSKAKVLDENFDPMGKF